MHGGNRARVAVAAASIAAALAALSPLYAQAVPGSSPDIASPVTDGPVYSVAHAPGGLTYIGGDFSHVGPRAGRGVPLASPATSGEGLALAAEPKPSTPSFPEVSGGVVKAVEPDGNGGWFIGGTFTRVGGASTPRLAHIRANGEVNTGWAPNPAGSSNPSVVLALAIGDSAGGPVLYVGGDFRSAGAPTSQAQESLAAFQLNTDRSPASSTPLAWAPGQAPDTAAGGGVVRALETATMTLTVSSSPRPTPVVFVGGDFSKIGAGTAASVARLAAVFGVGALSPAGADVSGQEADLGTGTGGVDIWNPNPGGTVRAIDVGNVVQTNADGEKTVAVYAGGDFTITEKNRLAAYRYQLPPTTGNPAGTPLYSNWSPAITGTSVGAIEVVYSPAGSPTVYAGGNFTQAGASVARPNLVALSGIPDSTVAVNGAATVDATWNPAPNGQVRSIAAAGGKIVVGGDFTSAGGSSRSGLAALDPAGSGTGSAAPWNPRLAGGAVDTSSGLVNAVAAGGGKVYAGGSFGMIGAEKRNNIAAIDAAGNVAGILGTGTACDTVANPNCIDRVEALTLSSDSSRLFVGGAFTKIEGADKMHLAALDAQSGTVVGGWTADADRFDSSGNATGDGWVMALEGAGNTLYAGGNFNRIGGVDGAARSRLAALDMTSGQVLDWRPDAECDFGSCSIHAIEASCGTVYAGGNSIRSIGGQPRNGLAALVPVGMPGAGQATSWDPNLNNGGGGRVHALARAGSTLYVGGGGISSIGGATRKGIAAIDAGTAKAVEGWAPSADGTVEAIDVSADGSTIYLGGQFHSIGGRSDAADLGAVQAVGVGDGKGNVVPWFASPRGAITTDGPNLGGAPVTYALDAVGDSVYVGGKFAEMGSRTQSGFSAFTSGADPAGAEPEICAHEVKAAVPAVSTAPAIEVPRVFDVRLTRKLKLLYRLSMPATVEIDLERKVNGYELPAPMPDAEAARGGAGSEDGKRPTVCKPPSDRNRRAATRIVKKDLGAKLKKLSPKKRDALIRKRLRKMRCTMFKDVEELSDAGEQGANEISLRPTDKKGKPKDLPRAKYRVTLLPLTEPSGPGAPVDLDFRVLRSGEAETETTPDGGEQGKDGTSR